MLGIEVFGLYVAVLQLVDSILQYIRKIISLQQQVLIRRFGVPLGIFISVVLRDTANRYEKIEKEVLNGTDTEALAFKQSVTNECNMTAIAVSPSNLVTSRFIDLITKSVTGGYYCSNRYHCSQPTRSESHPLDRTRPLSSWCHRWLSLCVLCLRAPKNHR